MSKSKYCFDNLVAKADFNKLKALFTSIALATLLQACLAPSSQIPSKVSEEPTRTLETKRVVSPAQEVANLMSGKFSSLSSVENAPENDNGFTDQRIILKNGPQSGVWLYYQLNTGANKKLYRQRFIRLVAKGPNTVIQTTFEPTKPQQWDSIWRLSSANLSLTSADIKEAFDAGCELEWTRLEANTWRGYVDPKTCEYFSSRRDSSIYIESETVLSASQLLQAERGYDAQGNQLFGTAPGELLKLKRVANGD